MGVTGFDRSTSADDLGLEGIAGFDPVELAEVAIPRPFVARTIATNDESGRRRSTLCPGTGMPGAWRDRPPCKDWT